MHQILSWQMVMHNWKSSNQRVFLGEWLRYICQKYALIQEGYYPLDMFVSNNAY